MNAEILMDAIGQVDEALIAQVDRKAHKRGAGQLRRFAALAASLVLIAALGSMFFFDRDSGSTGNSSPSNASSLSGSSSSSSSSSSASSNNAAPPSSSSDSAVSNEGMSTDGVAPMETEPAGGTVRFSDLSLLKGTPNEAQTLFALDGGAASIKEFEESMLAETGCSRIVEGTVTDVSVKHYTYEVSSDKFEPGGVLQGKTDTVVYAITVEKSWYGDAQPGETILVEDTFYFTQLDPDLSIQAGKRYVVPLYEKGETLFVPDYVSGDIARETSYSTVYVHHPQIQVTADGSYLFSADWTTLAQGPCKMVVIDEPQGISKYEGLMLLMDAADFETQMAVLIDQLTHTAP